MILVYAALIILGFATFIEIQINHKKSLNFRKGSPEREALDSDREHFEGLLMIIILLICGLLYLEYGR